jgi:hypothetical protein
MKNYVVLHPIFYVSMSKNRFYKKKIIKIPFLVLFISFALVGFFLTASYVAVKLEWTKDKGKIDQNDRYFQDIKSKYNQAFKKVLVKEYRDNSTNLHRILLLQRYAPTNANLIKKAYFKDRNEIEVSKMLDAVDYELRANTFYQKEKRELLKRITTKGKKIHKASVFEWMNIAEWDAFKTAVSKDKAIIDSVGEVTGVEPRLIVSVLVGEQIRLFNSRREKYKGLIAPLKVLIVESQFSLGVTGIKENTAIQIEKYLKDASSPFYLGDSMHTLLDFKSDSIHAERVGRLTNNSNHYYSYLYAALFLKEVKMQWQNAGYPIDDRPEILATLFNLGYIHSKPKKNPSVGGAGITIYEKEYSFGSVAYSFYYSGELYSLFPIKNKRFDWNI